ncbi:calcium release-activated calcium channel protein 1-like isoform X1 [Nymphalis io]|uniref:calcium release-activated calcium channel protein 1-like isoform X1 n=1 Tax=Inachis io TaxID=171585 RepID=UPI0021694ED1|nr:calcium release-activated calcium channel protein 1-like isoform X1 [Nymphalis io]
MMLIFYLAKMLEIPDNISEASFVTSVEEASRIDQCTQTPPCGKAKPRSLVRYNTTDHLYERHRPYRLKDYRPKSLGVCESYQCLGKPPSYDSGSQAKIKVTAADSPAISVTPPHSLEYDCPKGVSTPNGSVTPTGMLTNKSTATVLLSPSYLQSPCQCNQSIRSGSEVALAMPVSAYNEEVPGPASPDGLSWRRLHMSRAKLKATATTSELLSGFAMVAMVELQINEPTNVPEWLFVMFAVCTTVLVAVHIFALMISTYLLPNIDAVSKMDNTPGAPARALRDSPHERMRGFIELAWAFSTVLGLFLFLVEIAILCWVKFWDYSFAAATAATVIVIPVLIVFVAFAIHFYHSLVVQKCETSVQDIKQLENMKRDLDTATVKVNMYQ